MVRVSEVTGLQWSCMVSVPVVTLNEVVWLVSLC